MYLYLREWKRRLIYFEVHANTKRATATISAGAATVTVPATTRSTGDSALVVVAGFLKA